MAFRWRYPYSCSTDIRYVLGVLIPGCILVGKGLESIRSERLRCVLEGLLLCFPALSVFVYLDVAISML